MEWLDKALEATVAAIPEDVLKIMDQVMVQSGDVMGDMWFYAKALVILVVMCLILYFAVQLIIGG